LVQEIVTALLTFQEAGQLPKLPSLRRPIKALLEQSLRAGLEYHVRGTSRRDWR
jgi:hypothetical protein